MENNYQLSRIHNYINGLMTNEEMYELEKEAIDDPFLQDAIDGYALQHGVDVKQLSLLQQRLSTRIEQDAVNRNKRFYTWQRLAVASVAAVMFLAVSILFMMRNFSKSGSNSSEIKEIVINENFYEFNIEPSKVNTAIPLGGWEDLYNVLNSSYPNVNEYQGRVYVNFNLTSDGEIVDLILYDAGNEIVDEELSDILRNKVKWKGNKAEFSIEMYKIN